MNPPDPAFAACLNALGRQVRQVSGRFAGTGSRQNILHHLPVHIRQPEPTPLEFESEALVVDAHQVQHGRLEIVHMDRVAFDVVTEIVGFAVGESFLHASAGHPDRKTPGVVVAPEIVGGQLTLRVAAPPEFSAPDHQSIFQQSTLFQIQEQRRRSLVGGFRHDLYFTRKIAVLIPTLVIELNEPHPFFNQLSRKQAVG